MTSNLRELRQNSRSSKRILTPIIENEVRPHDMAFGTEKGKVMASSFQGVKVKIKTNAEQPEEVVLLAQRGCNHWFNTFLCGRSGMRTVTVQRATHI